MRDDPGNAAAKNDLAIAFYKQAEMLFGSRSAAPGGVTAFGTRCRTRRSLEVAGPLRTRVTADLYAHLVKQTATKAAAIMDAVLN